MAGVVMFFTAIQTSDAMFVMMILKRQNNLSPPINYFGIRQKVFQVFTAAAYPIDFNAVVISSRMIGSSIVARIVQLLTLAIFAIIPLDTLRERVFGTRPKDIKSNN